MLVLKKDLKALAILLLLVFPFGLIGCTRGNSTSNPTTDKPIVDIEFDWVLEENLGELLTSADLVVTGEIINVQESEKLPAFTLTGHKEPYYMVFTTSQIKIEKSIKGDSNTGDIIEVAQVGGEIDDQVWKYELPELADTNTYGIFFIRFGDKGKPNTLVNPYQGFVNIVNNKLVPSEYNLIIEEEANVNSFINRLKTELAETDE